MLAQFPTSYLPGTSLPAAGHHHSEAQDLTRQRSLQQHPTQQQFVTQQTWQRADLDAIGVPAACNLATAEVENMKQQWEGKPIQVHTGLQNCIQSETYSRELAQWKEYLLQVSQWRLSAGNLLVKPEVSVLHLQSAYDRLSVELGYQVFSSDEDGDVDDNEEN